MDAILLIGPTASGKSPIGNFLAKEGFFHFDFGEELRNAVKEEKLSKDEIDFIKEILKTNSLLPNEKLYIADKTIENFLKKVNFNKEKNILVLNGFPRNLYQAEHIKKIAEIKKVIVLECSPKIIFKRVRKRFFGKTDDHSKRDDDDIFSIENKLKIYNRETKLLIEYYEKKAKILKIKVKEDNDKEVKRTALQFLRNRY